MAATRVILVNGCCRGEPAETDVRASTLSIKKFVCCNQSVLNISSNVVIDNM